MTNKYLTLFNNTIIFAIGMVGSRMITFLLVPLYTNVLTREQYGVADLVMTCSFMLVPLISVAFQDAVLRFGLSKKYDLSNVSLNAIIMFIIGIIVTLIISPLISLYEPLDEWKWYLSLIIISNNACNIMYVYAKVKNQNKLYAFASILHAMVLALVNVLLLVIFKCNVSGYLIANILANLISAIILFINTRMYNDFKGAHFDRTLMREMLIYSIPLVANNISWWVLNSSDRIMIAHFLSPEDLGLYTAAAKIPALLSIVTSIFSSSWTISSIKDFESDKDKAFYSHVFCYFSLAMHLGAIGLNSIIKPFMSIYVGSEFYASWRLVPLLILGAVYFSYSSFFGAIYNAVKRNIMVTITTMIAALVNISINILLIPRIGVIAASISTVVGYIAIGVYRMINSRKYFNFPINFCRLILNSIILLIQTVLVTLDYMTVIVSVSAVIIMLILNYKDIKVIFKILVNKSKTRGK